MLGKAAGYNKAVVPFNGPVELGVVPWVAGDLGTTLGTATGAALAFKQEGSDRVCVCSFGDGTANRGDFHENVNLAALWRLPIVYVCENNGWAISQRATDYLPAPISARAAGYGIPGCTIDGHDVEAVRASVREAIERARRGGGPTLVEAVASRAARRWAGHQLGPARSCRGGGLPIPWRIFAATLLERGEVASSAQAIKRRA